jgi:hypothetical protein
MEEEDREYRVEVVIDVSATSARLAAERGWELLRAMDAPMVTVWQRGVEPALLIDVELSEPEPED